MDKEEDLLSVLQVVLNSRKVICLKNMLHFQSILTKENFRHQKHRLLARNSHLLSQRQILLPQMQPKRKPPQMLKRKSTLMPKRKLPQMPL
jgi:hypothetical protein